MKIEDNILPQHLDFEVVWFDSLGAKSSCLLVKTPDIRILIDPGIAVMHPSFPAPRQAKIKWYKEGYEAIVKASKKADIIVITHYHYDHFTDFDKDIYFKKKILAKDPNEYINDSQRGRAKRFYRNLYSSFGVENVELLMQKPITRKYPNPLNELPIAIAKNFGDYNKRRKELLNKGFEWFKKRATKWNTYPRIPELKLNHVEVVFADGKEFVFGETIIRFSKPLFHGIEFSRLGWVVAVVVNYKGDKLLYTSDLNGPIIEDYAEWIIKENPRILVLDGPATYMLGYTLNLINFRRTIANALKIVEKTNIELMIYDHHLTREPRFKERTKEVWMLGEKLGKRIVTAAELLGEIPAVLLYK